ncbi:hypothetical protein K501DRAFT_218388 [Backusella circina FSU 941]|nr:hypothetical protein K501DRAFT_218388 [Backusella circina FSU 941]
MNIETHIVYPTSKHNRPAPPLKIKTHGLDILGSPIQIKNHRFFHKSTKSFSDVIDVLKCSLAEALELYLPIAGCIQTTEEGDIYVVVDPDQFKGTPFIVEIKDIPYTVETEDLGPRDEVLLPDDASLLAVKVTQFSCGTIVVASSINHRVTDLSGYTDFLELWALIARGETVDYTRLPDDWTRQPAKYFPTIDKEPTPPPPFEVLSSPQLGPPAYLLVPSVVTRWSIKKDAMAQLKHDFSPKDDAEWISSGDALASLICGAITRARQAGNIVRLEGRSSEASQNEKIAMAADGRERATNGTMKYLGNFNCLWSLDASREDLLSPTSESGGRIALAIRKGLQCELSPEAIANKIAFFESPQNMQPPGRVAWSADLILTNWSRFDLQGASLDFGWGKPFLATSGVGGSFPPGYSVMTQNKETGDFSILVTVEHAGDEAIRADVLMNKYASLVLV